MSDFIGTKLIHWAFIGKQRIVIEMEKLICLILLL